MIYLVGDLQGCCSPFERLLETIDFSPSRDRIHLLGDLVNRGPCSLDTLLRIQALGSSATCLLGNHDLHLMAVAHGVRKPHRKDTLDPILTHPRREALLDWLRQQRLAAKVEGWLTVHAGVVPQWTATQTLQLAAEVQDVLTGDDLPGFLHVMYGNEPHRWSEDLRGNDRLRFIVNVLTRTRFVQLDDGAMEFEGKNNPDEAPPGCVPWYEHPERRTRDHPVAFGHWSTLGLMQRPNLLATDTGCVWGGSLTAVRVDGGRREAVQVECPQAQAPG